MTNWKNGSKIEIIPGSVSVTPPFAHQIWADDIDYIDAFLFEAATKEKDKPKPVDPESMIEEVNEWENLPQSPPPVSGYRPADVQGIACWNCAHFTIVGDPDNDGDLDGICELFEAQADAEYTCDRFTAHADLNRQGPHTSWTEDKQDRQRYASAGITEAEYADNSVFNAINFSAVEASEEDGLVWKEVLRTGEWKQTPTAKGVVDKELRIVEDGESDPINGIIALAELEHNFNEGAVPYVTVPLSDDLNDHKNIARLNTGFVRKLRRRKRDDGVAVLEAGIEFTEPDVKGKVLRGTIPDVSAGVPYFVTRRSDKKLFKAVLDHVCLTRRPFVDKLAPFGIAAADGDELPVESWEQEAEDPPESSSREETPPPPSSNTLSYRQQAQAIRNALTNQLRLGPEYIVEDITGTSATISHRTSKVSWTVPFRLTNQDDNPVVVASVDNWKIIESEKPQAVAASDQPNTSADQLRRARELRELRLPQPTSTSGGIQMSVLSLDGVELSNLDDQARARIQSVIDENARLHRENATTKVEQRIEELKGLDGLHLSDRPGALKLYQQIMLEDDGGPAVVLFSDKPESERKRMTAIEILDAFIDALRVDGGVQLSDQHLASGSDVKPPRDASDERKPLDDRVEEAKTALYGDRSKRRTGRK